jgi:hypothetical protein
MQILPVPSQQTGKKVCTVGFKKPGKYTAAIFHQGIMQEQFGR